jgi:hypothetical protein
MVVGAIILKDKDRFQTFILPCVLLLIPDKKGLPSWASRTFVAFIGFTSVRGKKLTILLFIN